MKPSQRSTRLLVQFDPSKLREAVEQCVEEARRLEEARALVLLEAATYRQLLQIHESKATGSQTVRGPAAITEARSHAAPALGARFKNMSIKDAAYAVLSEAAGKPMHGSDILKAIKEGGRPVGGKQPSSSLQGAMARDPRVMRTDKANTWKVREVVLTR